MENTIEIRKIEGRVRKIKINPKLSRVCLRASKGVKKGKTAQPLFRPFFSLNTSLCEGSGKATSKESVHFLFVMVPSSGYNGDSV
jgi:hypothetical protein